MSFGFGFSLPTLGWQLSGGGASSGYSVTKSLRFRASASAYLSRTFGTPTNNIKWTWSAWVKRGTLSVATNLLQGYVSASVRTALVLNSNDTIFFNPTVGVVLSTTAVFRDPAAWYHIICVYDSANATAGDRLILYVNGTRQTLTGTDLTPSQVEYINSANDHYLASGRIGATFYPTDCELAEVNFVDGQALTPTSFGASSTYNQWLPIKYAGTYGTNGFYLPFTNITSTSTLVADSSGNANNWTPNNISLTAGSTYDSLTDVPTLTSTTVANYAVLNPLDKDTARGTISDANLKFAATAFSTYNAEACRATMGVTTGKWYYEFRGVTQAGIGNVAISNFTTSTQNLTAVSSFAGTLTNYIGASASISGNALLFQSSGYSASLANSTLFASYASGDVVNIAVDFTAGKIWIGKNGTWYNSGDPGAGTNATSTFTAPAGYNLPEFEVATSSDNSNQSSLTVNFGQQPFTYTAPSGFLPLNTYNI